jgi:hypothetical protein
MKKYGFYVLMAFLLVTAYSCRKVIGEGPIVSENRDAPEFSAVLLSVPGTIYFTESSERKIEIDAQQNIINVIETYVSGNELRVKLRDNTRVKSHENITIRISGPNVTSLAMSGSGDLRIMEPYSPEKARFVISGSGNILVNQLTTGNLESEISGSGNIQVLNGTANAENITISGSGFIDFQNVNAKNATTNTSGSGTISLFVTDVLNVKISGSGSVLYRGNPQINATVSGSGKVVKL